VAVDGSLSYSIPSFSDADSADSHTYAATLSDSSALPSFITFSSGTFTFAPTDNSESGSYTIKVVVTDDDFHSSGGEESCEDYFSLTVEYVNHAPTFVNEHFDWSCSVYTDDTYYLPAMQDIDALDTLTRSVTIDSGSSLPAFLSFD